MEGLGGPPLGGVGPGGMLEDRGERTEVGGGRHETIDPLGEGRDRRAGVEGHRAGDRLHEHQSEGVDVGGR